MEINSENPKVVVHVRDGTLVKGTTQDFHPDRTLFRIVLENGVDTVPVKMLQLKAVFFVRDLASPERRRRDKQFSPGDSNRTNGRPVAVLFQDGELLVGYTNSYNPERQGFFMVPANADDNNLRIFVVRKSVKTLKLGPAAEEFVRAHHQAPESRAA
jgi:hypothetical protein